MKYLLPAILLASLLIGGCPLFDSSSGDPDPVTAVLTASATSGGPPLLVQFSGAGSSSVNGTIMSYDWDFGGLGESNLATPNFTFTDPGRYAVTLTVTDSTGEQGMARVYIRVQGGDVTAVIGSDKLSGEAPLAVRFDGTQSTAVDDTILDYYWDFGDGTESRAPAPTHVYYSARSYTVSLRVISAGGVEATATSTITVTAGEAASASLQFSGSEYARLPVSTTDTLSEFTFEAWCKPGSEESVLVSFGTPAIDVELWAPVGFVVLDPNDISLQTATALTDDEWQHLAISYSNANGAAIYVDGALEDTLPLTGQYTVSQLILGPGFHGNIAQARFWSVARSGTEVASDMTADLTGDEGGLLGDWPLNEGSGQLLDNQAAGGEDGTLGSGESVEANDPAWSTDTP